MKMSEEQVNSQEQKIQDPQRLVVHLYEDFVSETSLNLWPWETARWFELVFCILTAIGEPQVLAGTTRRLTNILSDLELLDISNLATMNSSEESSNPTLVTINTILQQGGFTPEMSKSFVIAICKVSSMIQKKYDGKIQNYLRKYGIYMVNQMEQDFGFDSFDNAASKALAIWLQNILNMPIPASNPLADKACESMGVTYNSLVEAANKYDINIALLDDALRNYWERRLSEKETYKEIV
jgi:hypothetical protein